MFNIIKNYKKPSKKLIQAFLEQDTATVHEAMGQKGALHSSIIPLHKGMKACGSALTVKSRAGDNLMILKALDVSQAGDFLVVDAGQHSECGPWGEITTLQAVVKGLAGLVIEGSVRDSAAIKEHGFPVYCKSTCVVGTAKASVGLINHPVTCGNVIVNPGDIVLADDDGVVAVPLAEAEDVLEKCRARVDKENKIMERIRAGETLFAITGLQTVLEQNGCTEEE